MKKREGVSSDHKNLFGKKISDRGSAYILRDDLLGGSSLSCSITVDWALESMGASLCRLSVQDEAEGKSHWLRSGRHVRPGAQLWAIRTPFTHT